MCDAKRSSSSTSSSAPSSHRPTPSRGRGQSSPMQPFVHLAMTGTTATLAQAGRTNAAVASERETRSRNASAARASPSGARSGESGALGWRGAGGVGVDPLRCSARRDRRAPAAFPMSARQPDGREGAPGELTLRRTVRRCGRHADRQVTRSDHRPDSQCRYQVVRPGPRSSPPKGGQRRAADVLAVQTREFRHPIASVVLVEPLDGADHWTRPAERPMGIQVVRPRASADRRVRAARLPRWGPSFRPRIERG